MGWLKRYTEVIIMVLCLGLLALPLVPLQRTSAVNATELDGVVLIDYDVSLTFSSYVTTTYDIQTLREDTWVSVCGHADSTFFSAREPKIIVKSIECDQGLEDGVYHVIVKQTLSPFFFEEKIIIHRSNLFVIPGGSIGKSSHIRQTSRTFAQIPSIQ
jgi:hypothetical protein